MRKEILLKVSIIILITVFFIFGLALFLKNIYKIDIIEKIKPAISEQFSKETEINGDDEEITIIDVTGLSKGDGFEHDCQSYLISNYDETNHWNECKLCHQKYEVVVHNLIDDGWSMGTADNCVQENVHKFNCDCGYSYTNTVGKKAHNMITRNILTTARQVVDCSVCSYISYSHDCYKQDGTRISCTNPGKCKYCEYNYAELHHLVNDTRNYAGTNNSVIEANSTDENGNVICYVCGTELGHVNYNYIVKESEKVFKQYISLTINGTYRWNNIFTGNTFGINATVTHSNAVNGNTWTDVATIIFNNHTEMKGFINTIFEAKLGNYWFQYHFYTPEFGLEDNPPTIDNINQVDNDQWERTKEIVVSGTENYCNSVKVELLDEEENIIYEGTVPVISNNWTITATPEIEADEIGKKFKVRVTDPLENSSTQDFTISKVDTVAPEITSQDKITDEWAKEKEFTFTATDAGSGNVSIAFNNMHEYQLAVKDGENYSRKYCFVGDVYKPVTAVVLYKDELGNTSSQEIKIDKIDNTQPTILDAKLQGSKLVINSNDEKEGLGEGSGVSKYRYITSQSRLENLELTSKNSAEVNKDDEIRLSDLNEVDFIYIVAEDLVGNVSEVYELRLQDLVLTSKVNLQLSNGKGGIELDWSDYDATDTYFVIYRKEENKETFEKIVDLNNKLSSNSYTDILANDKAKPIVPSVSVGTNSTDIQINLSSSDNGTKYTYYIEAYDSSTNILLKSSNKRSVMI